MDSATSVIDPEVLEALDHPSIWLILGFLAMFILQWRRDVSNPAKSASDSVLTDLAEHQSSMFPMLKEAADMAHEANKRADQAERGNIERDKKYAKLEQAYESLERRYDAIMLYVRALGQVVEDNGLTAPPLPDELRNGHD